MESILESSQERRIKRALLVVEGLTFLYDDIQTYLVAKNEGVDALRASFNKFVSEVYCIAHAALPDKDCGVHYDWLLTIEQHEALLKKMNIVDVEEHV